MFDWFQKFIKDEEAPRLGIDLGSSAIKLVETSVNEESGKLELATYGLASFDLESLRLYYHQEGEEQPKTKGGTEEKPMRERSIFDALSVEQISKVLQELLKKSETKSKIARFSLPISASFFTTITMPAMPDEEISAAIPFEAKKYIPIPLEEVALDWKIVRKETPAISQKGLLKTKKNKPEDESKDGQNKEGEAAEDSVQVILFAILKEAIDKYVQVAHTADLKVHSFEPESLSLVRVFDRDEKGMVLLLHIGFSSANIILVDGGLIRLVHSLKMAINQDTGELDRAMMFKEVQRVLLSYGIGDFSPAADKENKLSPVKCYVSGGGGIEPKLVTYLKEELGIETTIGDPFAPLAYPDVLKPRLKEIGPSFAIAAGLAMKE